MPNLSNRVVTPCLLVAVLALAGCPAKTPYPVATDKGQTPTVDVVVPEPAKPVETPARVISLIRTERGTTVVSGRDTGEGIVVTQIPGHAWLTDDGMLRVVKVRTRSPAVNTPRKRSSLAGLGMEEFSSDGKLIRTVDLTPKRTSSWEEKSAIIREAVDADPDLAAEFYHSERIAAIGSSGPLSAWLVTEEYYLGGAHPSSSFELLVVDLSTGEVMDVAPRFAGRDLTHEILRGRFETACVRDLCGVAPLEGPGGQSVWVALLCAGFEACEGQNEFFQVIAPEGAEASTGLELREQALVLPDGDAVERGVVDFRISPALDMAVVMMALGAADEVNWPWAPVRGREDRSKTREVRFWMAGMKKPVVIGRLPEVHSVQFLPAGQPSVDALTAIRAAAR
ncbi:MAG TPA: hypothetical protein PLY68_03600 [Myxococcota bacterium]|nr:hypothetical protein [Myxococcota bacterium]HNZ04237.1 hypothetical protein [Myxococcota bacterium]HOD08252.1 hypothetical protein [Myxococcota bacterium]HPB50633.1 hypothetical protein [Myxococcota bacterium]HQP95266.1 hypothetical protein [Myxococcota bacterium]